MAARIELTDRLRAERTAASGVQQAMKVEA
jgi:hypothetical protein